MNDCEIMEGEIRSYLCLSTTQKKMLSEVKDKFHGYINSDFGVRWLVPRFTFS